jgi:hypothetical protein
VYVNIRQTGQDLAKRRRGLSETHMTILPVPITPTEPTLSREEVRRALGIENRIAILTVGASYKYAPLHGRGFLDYMEPILANQPDAVLLAVGPEPVGRWHDAEHRTGHQVRALGARSDLPNLYGAADMYVNSFPFASVTATLEAAFHGLPVIEFRPFLAGSEILRSDSPGLGSMIVARDGDELEAEVKRLIRDPTFRNRVGHELKIAVQAVHSGAAWQAKLEEAYTFEPGRSHARPPRVILEDLDFVTAELQSQIVPTPGIAGRAKVLARRIPGFWFVRLVRSLPSSKERLALLRLTPRLLLTFAESRPT